LSSATTASICRAEVTVHGRRSSTESSSDSGSRPGLLLVLCALIRRSCAPEGIVSEGERGVIHTTWASARSAVEPFVSRTAQMTSVPGVPGSANAAPPFSGTFGPLIPLSKIVVLIVPAGRCVQM
jgi:hypothetical protein